jgi:tetratricopeptide (TPR) repeat protein/predicted MPP superfamily phosphohydrolase
MAPPSHLTWLHVSDLHFGHGDAKVRFDQDAVTHAIVQHARIMAAEIGPPDVVFVTGDLAFSGQPSEFQKGAEWIKKLREAVGGTPQVFLIPGNHDVDRKPTKEYASALVHKGLRAEPTKVDELLENANDLRVIWPKLSAFADCAEGFDQPAFTAEAPFFTQPIRCSLPGKITVVGLNTALLCLDDEDGPDPKNLALGQGQLVRAIEKQDNDVLLLVLQHHPPEWLLDGDVLNSSLVQRPHFQFTGHVHVQQGILHMPLLGRPRLQFAAGAGHKDVNEEGKHAYSWGRLSPEGLAYHSWSWDPDQRRFLPAHLQPDDEFYAKGGHAFVGRTQLPRRLQGWLPPTVQQCASGSDTKDSPSATAVVSGETYSLANPCFYIPYYSKGDRLVGRQVELAEITRLLSEPITKSGRVALSGIGGLGKTQLAVEYCSSHTDLYPGGIYWLDAGSDQNLEGQLAELCDRARWLHPDTNHAEKWATAAQRLRSHAGSLIVFDNLEDLNDIRAYFPESNSSTNKVMVLSRTEVPGWPFVRINKLDSADSKRLLENESGRVATTQVDQQAAEAIVQQLDGLPLALELVGAYLRHKGEGVSWDDCAQDLVRRGTEARSLNWDGFDDASATRHAAGLHAALALDEELLRQRPLLRQTLDMLAWAGSAPMGRPLISKLLDHPEPGDLADALAFSEQLRILSLERASTGIPRFRMHRLVQQIRRRQVQKPEGNVLALLSKRIGDFLIELREDFRNLSTFEAELPHLVRFEEYSRLEGDWPNVVRLKWLEAYPPYFRGQYRASQYALQEGIKNFNEHQIQDKSLEAHIKLDIGVNFSILGQYQEALSFKLESLEIRRRLPGDHQRDTATSLDSLGSTYRDLGRYQEAFTCVNEALEIFHRVLDDAHLQTLAAVENLSVTNAAVGEYDDALTLQERVVKIRREKLGTKHPQTALAIRNLSAIYTHLGKPDSALALIEEALTIQREVLGLEHPDIADSLGILVKIQYALKNYEEAFRQAENAWSMQLELLGDQHPLTAISLQNLGGAHHKLGRVSKAFEIAEQVLIVLKRAFGEDHPEVATALGNLGTIQMDLKRHGAAVEPLTQALKIRIEKLGPRHPDTAGIRVKLARCQMKLFRGVDALRTVQTGLLNTPIDVSAYRDLEAIETELKEAQRSGQALQKGFRQLPSPKKGAKPKQKK